MKQPWPIYTSRLKPRACTTETLRLCHLRWKQRKAAALGWSLIGASGLVAGAVAWWLYGEAFLSYITQP